MHGPKRRILHCLRAPVGGLFRHVRDLANEQAARGHLVGVLCDANAGDALTQARLDALRPALALGLEKISMSREVGPADISAARAAARLAAEKNVDVIHGHGAKGGAYARYAAHKLKRSGRRTVGFYTPHGGSLHYDPSSLKGRLFMAAERRLMAFTDGLIFESRYAADTFAAKVGAPSCPFRVIHNGILPEELRAITPALDAADIVFVGELRMLKGVDVLLDAMAIVSRERQRPVSAVIFGDGPDAARFRAQADALGISASVSFPGAIPARQAFPRGRVLVMPSRAESLPYVALEAAGAGLPLIATRVGGVPEIVAGTDTGLVPPDDAAALAAAIGRALDEPLRVVDRGQRLRQAISERFTVAAMTDAVLGFYDDALAGSRGAYDGPHGADDGVVVALRPAAPRHVGRRDRPARLMVKA